MLWTIYIVHIFILSLLSSLLLFWNNIFRKDILVWTIFSGLICYMNAVSRKSDETYIKKIIKEKFKLVIIGVIFIYKTIKVGISEYKNLNTWNIFISFTIPIVYLIFTLPLIYLIQLYSNYEFIFTRMLLKEVEKEKVNRKHRFIILRRCKYSVRKTLIVQKEYLPKIYKNMPENEFENLLNELKYR